MVDNNEFMRILQTYSTPIFKYCYFRLLQNKALTEETVNDIFSVLYQKWDSLDFGNIRAYLYRVADNCIKHNLSNYNRYYQHIESLEEAVENNKLNFAEQYDEYFTDDETPEEVYIEKIKQALPDEYREIFTYRYIEKKTLMETSELTGIPYSSVRLRLIKIEKIVRDEVNKIFN